MNFRLCLIAAAGNGQDESCKWIYNNMQGGCEAMRQAAVKRQMGYRQIAVWPTAAVGCHASQVDKSTRPILLALWTGDCHRCCSCPRQLECHAVGMCLAATNVSLSGSRHRPEQLPMATLILYDGCWRSNCSEGSYWRRSLQWP